MNQTCTTPYHPIYQALTPSAMNCHKIIEKEDDLISFSYLVMLLFMAAFHIHYSLHYTMHLCFLSMVYFLKNSRDLSNLPLIVRCEDTKVKNQISKRQKNGNHRWFKSKRVRHLHNDAILYVMIQYRDLKVNCTKKETWQDMVKNIKVPKWQVVQSNGCIVIGVQDAR